MPLKKELMRARMVASAPKPSNTLVVYVEMPEKVSFYLIPRLANKELLDNVRAVNGMYMNSDEFTKTQIRQFDAFNNWASTADGKMCLMEETPIVARITEVLHIGFAL